MEEPRILRPQKGKQELFLSTSADIALYGGSAGGGKTMALLLEALRHAGNSGFGAVVFRKEHTQITSEGGLWDNAMEIYPLLGAEAQLGHSRFLFPSGASVTFKGLGIEKDLIKWQGSQIALICFDELTHFTEKQFFYMLSRNRSTCGVRPYVRCTTNPEKEHWVRKFIDWWIGDDGYPIESRGGVIRYFVRDSGITHWYDTRDEAKRDYPNIEAKSFTFIPAKLEDNKILKELDPSYEANLQALNQVDKDKLLHGNWNAEAIMGMYFKRSYFEIVEKAPALKKIVRCWDMAGTKPNPNNPDPDYTVGLKAGIADDGYVYILDVCRFREEPHVVEKNIITTAHIDSKKTSGTIPRDVGSAGKTVAENFIRKLIGYPYKTIQVTGSKEARATPASSLAGAGGIKIVRGDWNEEFIKELEAFPLGKHDDQVDTLSDAIDFLSKKVSSWDY